MNTLTPKDLVGIEGGVIPGVLIFLGGAIAGGIISNVLDNWGDFKQGFREGYAAAASN